MAAAAAFDPRRAAAVILSAELNGLTLDDAERARRRGLLSGPMGFAAASHPTLTSLSDPSSASSHLRSLSDSSPSPVPAAPNSSSPSPSVILPGLRPISTKPRPPAIVEAVPGLECEDPDDDGLDGLDPSAMSHELRGFLQSIYQPVYDMQAKLYASRKSLVDLKRRYHDHVQELESELRRSESYTELLHSRIRELELLVELQRPSSPSSPSSLPLTTSEDNEDDADDLAAAAPAPGPST